ncbi:MAG TPA: DHA2 family efflux MFS transporter permease subunit [Phenylobacterium sp.]|uniref:DHA2 family efflux MFS transporter permease subunit n=1 Tax=Phenylobacterium sp. TaxID=1871053 RepID=UPI002D47DE2D|nr:DHA2 family efflux MFS transporter permease subunit [Phenylobacterium sp.]HZZ68495.1 DHA2 family efflux MFS transporter permease subunit [Phenylobacterium sp.]
MTAAESKPLAGAALGLTAFALALGTFMQVLDGTIANVSLPTIAGNLGASTDDSTWVITAFAAANGVTVPLTGWLMGRFGVVRTFVVSVTLFTLTSFLCGVAASLPMLVVFRLLQGAVSGPMIPGSQALLISIFPAQKRPLALGIWSITALVGPVAGPILGGYISDNYHWSLIFLINVPVGLFAGLVSWRGLRGRETPTRKLPIDTVGLALLAIWVGALQVVLDLGKNADWFNSKLIVVLTIVAAVAFVAWLIWELTDAHPAVDLSLFRNRNFALGTAAFCLGYALFFANNLLLPVWLQQQLGYTATWAGLVSAPSGAVAILLLPVLTRFGVKLDARWLATMAFAAFGVSYFMRAGYTTYSDFSHFMAPLLVQGVAMSTFFMAMLTISLHGVAPERTPSATGISNFARITGGSFAASIFTTLWDRRESLHQTRLADVSTPFSPVFSQAGQALGRGGLSAHQAAGAVVKQMVGQAYLLSSVELFWICGWLSFAMIALVWLSKRPAAHGGAIAAD